jgi:23S rRNA G2445 N2-methylase RlmL
LVELPGSLPPPIAAALAFVARPLDHDRILDPVCGTGTLLSETLALAPHAIAIGIDHNSRAIEAARRNLHNAAHLSLRVGDSQHAALPERSITLVIANLPFGKQFGTRKGNPSLYRAMLAEWQHCAERDRWRAVVLTSDVITFRHAASCFQALRIEQAFRVTVRGENATAFRLVLSA